jgi:hypothetical protein
MLNAQEMASRFQEMRAKLAAATAPATTIKVEMEEGLIDGDAPPLKRLNVVPQTPLLDQQVWPP